MRVSVSKADLLEDLRSNREKHRAIFLEALDGYREEAVRQLKEHIERIRSGSMQRVYISFYVPEDHTPDYDRIMGLIGMAQEESVLLSDDEYRMYVLDEWDWKKMWLSSNAAYSVTASQMINRDDEDEEF